MTYTQFLLIFTVIPITVLAIVLRKDLSAVYIKTLLIVSLIAFTATSVWDNYAVYSGIWQFPPEKTLGIYLYYVPIEEYAFFFLQTYLTGLVQLFILFRTGKKADLQSGQIRKAIFPLILFPLIANLHQDQSDKLILPFGNWNYLFHLFSWSGFFVLIQLVFGWKKITENLKLIYVPTLIMTVYFSLADSVSIGNGIWTFDPAQTIGTKVGNVPLEEILFFLMTNLLITEAMVLLLNQKYLTKVNNKNV